MRKTKDITKYDIEWQILRSSLKGKGFENLDQTLESGLSYFYAYKCIERWERVYNWIEGIRRGYISSANLEALDMCDYSLKELDDYKNENELQYKEIDRNSIEFQYETAKTISYELRYNLYKDLFKYEKDFTSRGYRHKELEEFVDMLVRIFEERGEDVKSTYSYEKILKFRENSTFVTSNKKFFF